MSEQQISPLPWHIERHAERPDIVTIWPDAVGALPVATLFHGNEADLALFMAAPGLLQACEAALTEMRVEGVAQLISPAMFAELKAAIAKARGEATP